jgi:hypothetical protein
MIRVSSCGHLNARGRVAVLLTALLGAGCAQPLQAPCVLRTEPGPRLGYTVEWTPHSSAHVLDELCATPRDEGTIRLEAALLRGTGDYHVGAALRRELEPRLERFVLDGWTLSCGRSFTLILNAKKSSCVVDEVIAVIGDYLRGRRASDRVVVMVGFWDAPAL